MHNQLRIFFTLFLSLFIISGNVAADWNSGITIEEIDTRIALDVIDKGIKVKIKMNKDIPVELDRNNFIQHILDIKIDHSLVPIIKSNTTDEIEIFYPYQGTHPDKLAISPAFKLIEKAGEKYIITVSHQGLPVIDHGVLTSAETLLLNWQDPWYSHFINPALKRGHTDPVMAFLYIEPQQIKSEIVVRVKEIAEWAQINLRDPNIIHSDEFESLKQQVGQFLLAKNKVSADSIQLSSILERVDYIRMGATDIQAYEPQQAQRQVSTLIGVSLVQHIKQLPNKVEWQWGLFNKKIQHVPIRAYDPAGLFDSYVTPAYPVFEWENMLADIDLPDLARQPKITAVTANVQYDVKRYLPLLLLFSFLGLALFFSRYIKPNYRLYAQISIFVVTASLSYYLWKTDPLIFSASSAELEQKQSQSVFKQLLWNIYQAFESAHEDTAYDRLAYSVTGNLQEKLYLQNRATFLIQDGAWSKVKSIEIKNLTPRPNAFGNDFLFDCEWLVTGDVIHWGHQHSRENLYRALIKIADIEGYWKIINLESIAQQRVD